MIDLKAIRKWQARGDIPALVDWIERASMLLGCASFVGAGTDACHECGRIAQQLFFEVHAEVPVYPQFSKTMLEERIVTLELAAGKLLRALRDDEDIDVLYEKLAKLLPDYDREGW